MPIEESRPTSPTLSMAVFVALVQRGVGAMGGPQALELGVEVADQRHPVGADRDRCVGCSDSRIVDGRQAEPRVIGSGRAGRSRRPGRALATRRPLDAHRAGGAHRSPSLHEGRSRRRRPVGPRGPLRPRLPGKPRGPRGPLSPGLAEAACAFAAVELAPAPSGVAIRAAARTERPAHTRTTPGLLSMRLR